MENSWPQILLSLNLLIFNISSTEIISFRNIIDRIFLFITLESVSNQCIKHDFLFLFIYLFFFFCKINKWEKSVTHQLFLKQQKCRQETTFKIFKELKEFKYIVLSFPSPCKISHKDKGSNYNYENNQGEYL